MLRYSCEFSNHPYGSNQKHNIHLEWKSKYSYAREKQRVSALKTLYLDRIKHKSFFFYKSNMVIVRFKVTTNGVVTLPSENKSENILCDTKALSNHDIETKPS